MAKHRALKVPAVKGLNREFLFVGASVGSTRLSVSADWHKVNDSIGTEVSSKCQGFIAYLLGCFVFYPFSPTLFLIVAKTSLPKRWGLTHPFQFFDLWALWRSGSSARVPKCQKIEKCGLDQYSREHFWSATMSHPTGLERVNEHSGIQLLLHIVHTPDSVIMLKKIADYARKWKWKCTNYAVNFRLCFMSQKWA